jgi:murein DD-endopeptidase MepM/ murein hydrolase activator NlpD
MRRALSIVAASGLAGGALLAATSGAASTVHATASAWVAAGYVGPQGAAHAGGTASDSGSAAVSTGGLSIRAGETSARTAQAGGTAHASAVARSVTLLDGRVTAYGVRRTADVTRDGSTYTGAVNGLKVDGRPIGTVTDARTYTLSDGAGKVVVNKGTIGLRLVLTRDASGLPQGADVQVAVATGAVTVRPAPKPTATPTATASATPSASPKSLTGGKARKTHLKRRKAPAIPARLTSHGYAFPVYGKASVADNFGAVRAAPIVVHEGDDIFADFGTPVVAVADGTISRVGTLPISGNRLWVTSTSGDWFFYAHLSAFSPAAVDGAKVKAGTVLGFVGNTGDAEPTPPHLHFEVHPGGEQAAAVDPYSILTAWQGRRDVAPGAWLQHNGADTTQRPGALVSVQDFIAE